MLYRYSGCCLLIFSIWGIGKSFHMQQLRTYCSACNMNFGRKCERAALHPLMFDFKIRNLMSDQAPVGTLRCFNSSVKNMETFADAKFHGNCYNQKNIFAQRMYDALTTPLAVDGLPTEETTLNNEVKKQACATTAWCFLSVQAFVITKASNLPPLVEHIRIQAHSALLISTLTSTLGTYIYNK